MSSRATGSNFIIVAGIDFPTTRPRIEMLADGGWVVIWTQDTSDGSFYGVYQQRYDPLGNPVGAITQVNTQTVADQVTGDVAGLPDGGWLVTWHDFTTGNVNFQRYDAAGVPVGGETRINTTSGQQTYSPSITVLADGGWVIAWEFNGTFIHQQRFDADGAAIGGEFQVNGSGFNTPTEAQTVALADGGWVVSWNAIHDGTGSREIRMRQFDAAGNEVLRETTVNTSTANEQILSRLCALADGGWVVTWQGYDGTRSQVYMQRYSSDGVQVGGEVVVNPAVEPGSLGNFDADVAALADGGWIVTYKFDGATDGIYQQRYDANGLEVGGRTRLDSGQTMGQDTPQVVATPDGGWNVVWLEAAADLVLMRHFANDIYGTTGADSLLGTNWDETLVGLAGNDSLDGRDGDDVMIGGFGDDTYFVQTAQDQVRELFGQGIDTVFAAVGYSLLPTQAESLTLTGSGNTNAIGNGLANLLVGNLGANTLNGLNGNDSLDGGQGNDILNGGAGNDVMIGGTGNDRLAGGSGRDTAGYGAATAAVTVNLALIAAQNTGGAGSDTLVDVEDLVGSAFNDTLSGNDSDNAFEGAAGNDTMTGGLGVDTLLYTSATAGVTVRLGQTSAQNTVGAGTDIVSGFENVVGSAFNDSLSGDAAANAIEGGAGNDVIDGNGGIDTATYASASSRVNVDLGLAGVQNTTGAGNDTLASIENLIGSAFNDSLTGSAGANQIEGGAGNDTIQGAGGADKIIGGFGQDTLFGNAGADRFIFDDGDSGRAQAGADAIFDFSQIEGDRIALSQIDANIGVVGDQGFAFIGSAAFTGTAGQLRQYTDGAFTVIAGDTNGDSQADFLIYLVGNYTLVSSDFIL